MKPQTQGKVSAIIFQSIETHEHKEASKFQKQLNLVKVDKFVKLMSFLEENDLHFWDSEYPLVRETSDGKNHFVDVTISIKLS